jgi:hypothetical protein
MMMDTHDIDSLPGALKPGDPTFRKALLAAQQAMNDALDEFQRVTGRMVVGVSLDICDVTTLLDQRPLAERGSVEIAWAPTYGEREAERKAAG